SCYSLLFSGTSLFLDLRSDRSFFDRFQTYRLALGAEIIAERQKNSVRWKPKNLGGKFQRQVKSGKEHLGIEERIHPCDPIVGKLKDNEGPGLVSAVRVGPILAKGGRTTSRSRHQPRPPAA